MARTAAPARLSELEREMYRVRRALNNLRTDVDIDRAGLGVLWALEEHGEQRMSDVAAFLGLDLSTVSRQVRTLADEGLLARVSDPVDGRASRLSITGRGTDVLDQFRSRRRAVLSERLRGWTADDVDTLTALLGRIADDLGPDPSCLTTRRETAGT